MSYLCVIELSEDIGEFANIIETEFNKCNLWDVVDKGKIKSFRFVGQKTMIFSIDNSKDHDIHYTIHCLKPSYSEQEHDGFRHAILKDSIFEEYSSHKEIADIIAGFAGFHHNEHYVHQTNQYNREGNASISILFKYLLAMPFSRVVSVDY